MQRPGMHNLGAPVRVVFMGTPDFAVPSLRALLQNAAPGRAWHTGLDVVGVITRPDKPAGRGRQVVPSPVKQFAEEHGIPVAQPRSLRQPEAQEQLVALAPDVIVVAAYGQILPPAVLNMPRFGSVNVHASLLPRHRGAAPIAGALLAGDQETGVTIMLMDEGLDTGAILTWTAMPIASDDTTGTLTEKLSYLGAEALLRALPRWFARKLVPQPQDETRATLTRPLTKDDGIIDWRLPAEVLARQIRAYHPWPGTATTWHGKTLKVLRAAALEAESEGVPQADEIGKVSLQTLDGGKALVVRCGQGALRLEMIQLEGKRALTADEFARGQPGIIGDTLGT